ncbi:right-handed parallel beta-helix repeat-containing protein [Bosea sp. WAO]|uniref:right-handed parallel beta-helix repeat-containing protein n=1 Tax=Bosea sp. WAO TaxID=406341 RepID=UPI000835CD12|nr:right-handed parallel beta-helix repeat-containing protein [Bosea sp. WAO]
MATVLKAATAGTLLLTAAAAMAAAPAALEPQPASACPAQAVRIARDSSLSRAVENSPAGTVFCIEAGLHRMQSAQPKPGQQFFGEPGAILSGAAILSRFTFAAGVWTAAGPGIPGQARGVCKPGREACQWPEIVFLDGEPLEQVAERQQLRPGSFFHDRLRNLFLLADAPDGRLVEVSSARYALFGAAPDVAIRGLIVEKYANPPQEGAIRGDGPGWRIEDCEFRLNSGAGVSVGPSGQVLRSNIHDNGQIGATADGFDILFEGNTISRNNRHGFDPSWDAGGIKVTVSQNVTFRNNDVHENDGPGLWCDERCVNVTFEGNRVTRNSSAGIFFELSSKAVIRNNVLSQNNQAGAPWYWGAEIQIAASEEAAVHDNVLEVRDSGRAIMLIDQNRWKVGGGFYKTRDNRVTDNNITFLGQGSTGGVSVSDPSAANFAIIERGGNLFDRNVYRVAPGAPAPRFAWGTLETDFAGFRTRGQERQGSLTEITKSSR